jgi:hypothetical protein
MTKEDATLASDPAYKALKLSACVNRAKPGVDKRNMISPNVITLFFIRPE